MELRADREYLRTVAYADGRLLGDRVSLYAYQQPRIDLRREVLDRLGDLAGGLVVDVGCGDGAYVGGLAGLGARVVAVDLSPGMLAAVDERSAARIVADAERLPLRSATADAVCQLHMLYHLPEPTLALDEARRVLAGGGRLVATVGGPRHLAESNELWAPLLAEAGLDAELRDLGLVNTRLAADRLGELLAERFATVRRELLASTVVVTDPAPLVRHTASTTAAKVTAERGADLLGRYEAAVAAAIEEHGEFRVTTEVALFVAVAE